MEPQRIYLSPPHLSGLEREFIMDALDSNWIAPLGPHVDAFERELAHKVGARFATAVNSGTGALHLALRIAGVGRGDDVLVSTLTFVASASPALFLGARPVFIDSEPLSWNMDAELLEATLDDLATRGRLPRAVVVVHLFGQTANMNPILLACERYNIPVIEDAAEALGATYLGRSAGTIGMMGVFSFNGNKTITTSGGGMLVSANPVLTQRAKFLASQARDPARHYQHSELGYNYRLSNILAALGRAQLLSLDERVAARRRNARIYQENLADLPGVHFQEDAPWGRHARWLTCMTIDPNRSVIDRDDVLYALEAANIEARPVWKPLHQQPLFSGCTTIGGRVADDLFENGLCLPSGSSMTDSDLERVIGVVRFAFQGAHVRVWPGADIPAHAGSLAHA